MRLPTNEVILGNGLHTMASTNCGVRLLCVIKKEVPKLLLKKKWLKSRISYYSNLDAMFNYLALSIQLCGDVHPLPGPESVNYERITIRSTTHRHAQKTSVRGRNLANCIIVNSSYEISTIEKFLSFYPSAIMQ